MGSAAVSTSREGTATGHDIPSLDGLRAVSIAIVVLSHTKPLLPAVIVNSGLFRYVIGGGLHGVQIFFVISGYLITTLLLRELRRNNDVSFRAFYVRRTFRIFPPFYFYLAVVALLWAAGVKQDASTFLSAATYTIIYHPDPQGWMLQHTWSLSIEEQFYLLWPVLLVFTRRRGAAARVALAILIAMPFARVVVAFTSTRQPADHLRLIVNMSAIDMLMTGCLLALLTENDRWRRWCERWITGWSALGVCGLGLVVVPYATVKLAGSAPGTCAVALGYSATAVAVGAVLEHLVRVPHSIAGRILNFSSVRHIGVISYSIYLWQQAFTGNPARFGLWTYALILLSAEASFWLVERPMMSVRARFRSSSSDRLQSAELTSSATRVSVSGASPNASTQ